MSRFLEARRRQRNKDCAQLVIDPKVARVLLVGPPQQRCRSLG
jgi:hypothetical protein